MMDDTTGRYLDVPSRPFAPGEPMTLHLGVLDQPYRNWELVKGSSRRKQGAVLPVTTGDVAGWLEKRYHVMETFYNVHQEDVSHALEDSLAGALESLLIGRVVDPWGSAVSKIQTAFRQFISSREAENVGIPGTPTLAALRGINHRLKHPYSSRNPRRPSFRDTGLYMGSMRAWVD